MIELHVNGKTRKFRGAPFKRLLDVLREDFGLTGSKEGCGEGECGACTVLLDGEPVNACLVPVVQVQKQRVTTIEAVGTPEKLDLLQESFVREGGAQCGICTPGMVMTAWAYLRNGGGTNRDAIREALAGNLCRCTGYQHIVEAVATTVRAAHRRRRARKK